MNKGSIAKTRDTKAEELLAALKRAAGALPRHTQSLLENRTAGCTCSGCVVRAAIAKAEGRV